MRIFSLITSFLHLTGPSGTTSTRAADEVTDPVESLQAATGHMSEGTGFAQEAVANWPSAKDAEGRLPSSF
jgi:hypothetical protein